MKRLPSAAAAMTSSSPSHLGPKRKRGRPRRLSGTESVPLAVNLADENRERMMMEADDVEPPVTVVGGGSGPPHSSPHHHHHHHHQHQQHQQQPMDQSSSSETEQSPVKKSLKEGSRAMSLSPGGKITINH